MTMFCANHLQRPASRPRVFARMAFAVGLALAGLTPALAGEAAAPSAPAAAMPQLIYVPANSAQADHAAIIRAFSDAGFQVSTYGNQGEEGTVYARRVADAVKALISQGISPAAITVVGSGAGSTVTQLSSAMIGNRHVNYVLLGRCDRALKERIGLKLTGRVLGIRDAGTNGSGSCRPIWHGAQKVSARRDIAVNTGLGEALFYRPHTAWMQPTVDWSRRRTVDIGEIRVSVR